MTCGHFKKANQWLRERYGEDGIIDWNLVAPDSTVLPAQLAVSQVSSSAAENQTMIAGKQNVTLATDAQDDYDEDISTLEALVTAESALGERASKKK